MTKKIGNIAVTALSNGAHFNYMQSTLKRANASEAVKTKAAGEISKLQAAFEVEDANLKLMTKSEMTKLIEKNDAIRDSCYSGFKSVVKGFLALPECDIQAAAEKLWNHIESYKIVTTDQLDKETGMLQNFIDDLEKKYATQVTTLGLTPLVENMKEANNQVLTLMDNRTTESSTKTVGAMKAARAATDAAYRTLVEKVNALAIVEGDTEYASFIDEMNAQITHYKREALGQTTSSSSSTGGDTTTEDDAPVVDGGGTTDEGGSEDDVPDLM